MALNFVTNPLVFSVAEGRRAYKLLRFSVGETEELRTNIRVVATIGGHPRLSLHAGAGWSAPGGVLTSDQFSLNPPGQKTFDLFVRVAENAPAGTLDATVTLKIGALLTRTVDVDVTVTAQAPIQLGIVLDRSASMGLATTVGGPTRSQRMREAASLCRLLLNDQDQIALIVFNLTANRVFGLGRLDQPFDPFDPSSMPRGDKLEAVLAAGAPELAPSDLTSISAAVTETQAVLAAGTGQSALYLTDGLNDRGRTDDLLHWSGARFAVGVMAGMSAGDRGRACEHLAFVAAGRRALHWTTTGAAATDFKFDKYVTQAVLNVAAAEFLADPEGVLTAQRRSLTLEFDLTEADYRYDVVALSDRPDQLRIRVVDPKQEEEALLNATRESGTAASGHEQAEEGRDTEDRPSYDVPKAHEPPCSDAKRSPPRDLGPRARVLSRELRPNRNYRRRERVAIIEAPDLRDGESLRYSVVIGIRSDLRLDAEFHSSDLYVGAQLLLSALVTQTGDVLRDHVKIAVELQYPDGDKSFHELRETQPGRFTLRLDTFRPGIYEARFMARGRSHLGLPFTREALRTLVILDATARLDPPDAAPLPAPAYAQDER